MSIKGLLGAGCPLVIILGCMLGGCRNPSEVPGVIITQHSGAGKANQFFLRGFNLDHGTDSATSVAGMPVNFPTHSHGQGYTDLNFLIPELVSRIDYRKGPSFADEGDFSAAGAAHIKYAEELDRNIVQFTGGSFDYYHGPAVAL